jgi:hypothetical protein
MVKGGERSQKPAFWSKGKAARKIDDGRRNGCKSSFKVNFQGFPLDGCEVFGFAK